MKYPKTNGKPTIPQSLHAHQGLIRHGQVEFFVGGRKGIPQKRTELIVATGKRTLLQVVFIAGGIRSNAAVRDFCP